MLYVCAYTHACTHTCKTLTSDGIHKIMKLPFEDVQGVLQDLVVIGFTQGNQSKLLLHCATYRGKHQLCIYKKNPEGGGGIDKNNQRLILWATWTITQAPL